MELNKTIKNIKRWNQTKIKPLKYICFFHKEDIYNFYYQILWSNDDLILVKDYNRSYLMSLYQWKYKDKGNIKIKNNSKDDNEYFLTNIVSGDYVISDEKLNQIKEEIFKPYFL